MFLCCCGFVFCFFCCVFLFVFCLFCLLLFWYIMYCYIILNTIGRKIKLLNCKAFVVIILSLRVCIPSIKLKISMLSLEKWNKNVFHFSSNKIQFTWMQQISTQGFGCKFRQKLFTSINKTQTSICQRTLQWMATKCCRDTRI